MVKMDKQFTNGRILTADMFRDFLKNFSDEHYSDSVEFTEEKVNNVGSTMFHITYYDDSYTKEDAIFRFGMYWGKYYQAHYDKKQYQEK